MTTARCCGRLPSEQRSRGTLALGAPEDVVFATHLTDRSPSTAEPTASVIAARSKPRSHGPSIWQAMVTRTAADLAAAYASALPRITALSTATSARLRVRVTRLFLADNGHELRFDPLDAVRTMEGVAAGEIDEAQLAPWLRRAFGRLTKTHGSNLDPWHPCEPITRICPVSRRTMPQNQ